MSQNSLPKDFKGSSFALSIDGIGAAQEMLSVRAAEIWTVLSVETGACGFMPDRRPPILFERHAFSRLTDHQFDICDVSNPSAGGYGADGPNQYDRLADAMEKDQNAAIQSASWGMPQIMGENFASAGYADAGPMIASICESEDNQLMAFANFLKNTRSDVFLRSHSWASFAARYNGANYKINAYDVKLAQKYAGFSAGPLPDLTIRRVQLYLTFAGYHPGAVDGMMGARTRAAIESFQQTQGIAMTGIADEPTIAALLPTN